MIELKKEMYEGQDKIDDKIHEKLVVYLQDCLDKRWFQNGWQKEKNWLYKIISPMGILPAVMTYYMLTISMERYISRRNLRLLGNKKVIVRGTNEVLTKV